MAGRIGGMMGSFRGVAWAVSLASCASMLASPACGGPRDFGVASAGGSAGAGASVSAGANAGGESIQVPTECEKLGALRCRGNVRQRCSPEGEWQPLPEAEQCGGAAPACTGDGVCAAYRQKSGGIDTFATYPSASNYVLRRQTLGMSSRTCGGDYCVRGGVRP
jgi:hypothetical protein